MRGAEHLGVGDVDAELGGAGSHRGLVAEDGQVGDLALQHPSGGAQDPVVVTLGQHDAFAIGAGAFDQLVLEHLRCHDRRGRNLDAPQQFRSRPPAAPSGSARCPPCPCDPTAHPATGAVHGAGGVVGAEFGGRGSAAVACSPSISRAIAGCGRRPPFMMIPASDGKPSASWAFTRPSSTSDRSPGAITTMPSESRSRMCSAVMPPTMTRSASRCSNSGSPL